MAAPDSAGSSVEEAELACFARQQARDTLAQRLEDGEVVRDATVAALDANLKAYYTLTRQLESGKAIRDTMLAALNTIRRILRAEARRR